MECWRQKLHYYHPGETPALPGELSTRAIVQSSLNGFPN
jgi:hypothetical protein